MDINTDPDLSGYVNNLYRAAISIAALLAVIRIIFAGFQYMLSDIVTQKTEARKSIKNALLGLLIVIGAVLILETINPNLVQVTALTNLQGMVGDLEQTRVERGELPHCGPNEYYNADKKCVPKNITDDDVDALPTTPVTGDNTTDADDPRTKADYNDFKEQGVNINLLEPGYIEINQEKWEAMSLIQKRQYESKVCDGSRYLRRPGTVDNPQIRYYCFK